MGLGHSPRIVTDGLVLALDAQNSKSWKSGTTWTDASRNGNDVTLTGGISHSDGPFPEAGYVEFDGSTEYLSIADSADFDMSSSIYTWELWFYTTDIGSGEGSGGYGSLFSKCTASSSVTYGLGFDGSGNLFFKYWNGSGTVTTTATTTIVTGKWYHVAVVKDAASATSGNTKIFVNGNLEATTAVSGTFYSESSNPLEIGRDSRSTTDYFQGYISNLRAVKGTALYTSNFTPPSSPLTAVTNTKLLCCQGGTNVDASPSAHSFQVIIGVPTLTSVGPSATKYFEFDGANDYIREDTILDTFTSTSDPWSIECWFNTDVNPSVFECMIAFNYNSGNENTLLLGVRDDSGTCRIAFYYSHTNLGNYGTVTVGQWHHLAATHTTGGLKVYLDGTQIASNAGSPNRSLDLCAFLIGAELDSPFSGPGNYFDGKISNVKMYNKGLTAAEVQQNYNALKGRYV